MKNKKDVRTGMNCFTQTKDGEDIFWCIMEDDAQLIARDKHGRELTERELGIAANAFGHGMEGWHVILTDAVEIAVEQTKEEALLRPNGLRKGKKATERQEKDGKE